MPEPVKRGQRYMPGLDGLRAIAVLGVILYHVGFTWIPGGLLGVGVFFTLSGYLITDLLLAQADSGGIRLGRFWLARARRLLPALLLMLVVVLAWVTVIGPHQPADFRTAAITGALYVNNWWLTFHDVSYFEAFAAPQPLNHLWSLSVEEQFYILWPFMVIVGLRFIPDRRAPFGMHPRLALATLGLAAASGILMAILYTPGLDPSRVYYGTDTRALELLIGAVLAMVWPSRRLQPKITAGARNTIDAVGLAGLAVIAVMFLNTGEYSSFLYRGGFLVLSLASAMLIAALAHPASRLGPAIGCSPMKWIGERSYGIYLWHFPIIILTTPEGARGVSLVRATLQIAATFAIAALSWRYVEDPIRHGALARRWAALRSGNWPRQPLTGRRWAVLGLSSLVLLSALAGLAGAGVKETKPGLRDVTVAKTITGAKPQTRRADQTVCSSVVHIGDSTSLGLESADYLPDPSQRISAQYARVGATTQHLDIQGGRSIYERYKGQPNAREAAEAWLAKGVDGCWVLAMGTNETANVAAGSTISLDQRIDQMMSAIGDHPVLWVNTKTLAVSGPYAADNMKNWNAALLAACDRYPNMRVYDWASEVKDEWFVADSIHFTTPGYAARARYIADALLAGFPASGGRAFTDRRNCLLRPKHAAVVPGTASGAPAAGATGTTGGQPVPAAPAVTGQAG